MSNEATPGSKERVIFLLKSLLELVENDQVRSDQIANLTTTEILELAEAEADKAVQNARRLKDAQE